MTLKYSDFYESEIMRNLAKIAVDEGMITSSEVENSVSKLAGIKALSPSKDLFADVAKFAAALRKKGYVEEADGIEQKMFMLKQAESQYYDVFNEEGEDLIEFAHQDGEAEVAPSSGGHGVVETEITGHQKRLNVVNKKPTGKYASEITNMLLLASEVLKIKKEGQETEAASADPDAINEALLSLYDDLDQLKTEFDSALFSWSGFTLRKIDIWLHKETREFYEEKAELGNSLTTLYNQYKVAYGKEIGGTPDDLVKNMLSKNYDALKQWAANAGIDPKYFIGSRPADAEKKKRAVKQGYEVAKDNNASIWVVGGNEIVVKIQTTVLEDISRNVNPFSGLNPNDIIAFSKDESLVEAAASSIHEEFNKKINELTKSLPSVNEKIQEKLNDYKKLVNAAWFSKGPQVKIEISGESNAPEIINSVNAHARAVSRLTQGVFKKKYERLIKRLHGTMSWDAANKITGKFAEIASQISKLLEPVAKTGPLRQAMRNFAEAKNIFDAQMDKLNPDSKEYLDAKKRSQVSANYLNAIRAGIERGDFEYTQRLLHSTKTQEEWIAGSQEWLNGAKALAGIKTSSAKSVKLAQEFNPAAVTSDTGTSGTGTGAKPSGGTPQARHSVTTSGQPEKDAVTPMQNRLNQLGTELASGKYNKAFSDLENEMPSLETRLLSTGKQKGPNAPQDGIWGPQTFSALEAAAKILNSWNSKSQQKVNGTVFTGSPNLGYAGHADTVEKAKTNTDLLNRLLEALSGRSAKGPSYGKFMFGGKEVEIGQADLATLSNLLNFMVGEGIYDIIKNPADIITSASIKIGQTEIVNPWPDKKDTGKQEDEWNQYKIGLNFSEWKKVLQELAEAANNQRSNPDADRKSRMLALQMNRQVGKLWNDLKSLREEQGADPSTLIDVGGGMSYSGRGRGRGRSPDEAGAGYPGGFSKSLESTPSTSLIDYTLDLRNPIWGDLDSYTQGLPIYFDDFRRYARQPDQIAKNLGLGRRPSKLNAIKRVLQFQGRSPTKVDKSGFYENGKYYRYKDLPNYKSIKKQYRELLNVNPLNELEEFIGKLQSKITDVRREIAQDRNIPDRELKNASYIASRWIDVLDSVAENIVSQRGGISEL